jgi:hypothetical protein
MLARQENISSSGMIAEKVSWRHSDASGQTERYSTINGMSTGRGVDNNELTVEGQVEYEPLGQRISVEDLSQIEFTTGDPQPIRGNASNPEWQCSLPSQNNTSFWDLPVQCQIERLETDQVGLKELFSAKNSEGNAKAVTEESGSTTRKPPVLRGKTDRPTGIESEVKLTTITAKPSKENKKIDEEEGVVEGDVLATVDIPFSTESEIIQDASVGGREFVFQDRHNDHYSIGFSNTQKTLIDSTIKFIYDSTACAAAFENAGLNSYKTLAKTGHYVFVRAGVIGDSKQNGSWLGNEAIRTRFENGWNDESTVNSRNGQTIPADDPIRNGNYYTALKNIVFENGNTFAIQLIIHEIIHSAGAPGNTDTIDAVTNYSLFGYKIYSRGTPVKPLEQPSVDLTYLNFATGKDGKTGLYDAIISACTPK